MATEKNIHPAMARLYEGAIALKLIDGEHRQSALARLLNVPSQNVKHWERRGPSKDVRLRFQAEYGINATWVETGEKPPEKPLDERTLRVGDAGISPAGQRLIERLKAIEASGASSPQFIRAVEAVLDLVQPRPNTKGYPGLEQLKDE